MDFTTRPSHQVTLSGSIMWPRHGTLWRCLRGGVVIKTMMMMIRLLQYCRPLTRTLKKSQRPHAGHMRNAAAPQQTRFAALARQARARSRRASKLPQHTPRKHVWGGRPAVARKHREPACPGEPHRGPAAPGQVHACASGHGAQPGREGFALHPPRAVRRRTRQQDRGAPPQCP